MLQLALDGMHPVAYRSDMAPPRKRVKMVRHEMQFSPSMLAWLRLEAQRQDSSVAKIVRQAVVQLMESQQ